MPSSLPAAVRRAALALGLAAAALAPAAIAALPMPAAAQPAFAQDAGMRTTRSPHAFPATVERLAQAIEKNAMIVVARASASAGAAQRGVSIRGNAVLMAFRNDFAVRMLAASVPAGFEAPIRFYVTEDGQGAVWLSYRPPSAVFAPYADGGEALKAIGAELDPIFAAIAADTIGAAPLAR